MQKKNIIKVFCGKTCSTLNNTVFFIRGEKYRDHIAGFLRVSLTRTYSSFMCMGIKSRTTTTTADMHEDRLLFLCIPIWDYDNNETIVC